MLAKHDQHNLLRIRSSLRIVMTVDDDVFSSLSLHLHVISVPFGTLSVGLIKSEYTRVRLDSIEKVNVMLLS